ncbi:hypothetical protein F5B17DRAFT_336910 [Nemania serpens]|nr:hypothetical protein F5B17DRAFT_336910 [Nemania serpens]
MQINTMLGALFAATASGAAIESKKAITYDVQGFSAGCIPHSVECSYGFQVVPSTAAPGSSGTTCGSLVSGPDFLPPVALTACADPKIAYAVAIANGGLTLTITSAVDKHTNATGTYTAPASEFTIYNGGSTQSQIYVGPTDFTIDAVNVKSCQ